MSAPLALNARHYGASEYGGGVNRRRWLGAGRGVEEQCVLIGHTAQQISQELVAVLHAPVNIVKLREERVTSTTCCVFSCSQDGTVLRPKVNAGGDIFCRSSSRELAVRGG